MKPITILLAEDHSIVREGLRTLLSLSDTFDVVGEASSGTEAVDMARKLHPQIVVMDIAMPGLNGFEATRQILASDPECRILVLSAHSDDEYVAHMAAVGASGYLVKQNSGKVLVRAIKEIAAGRAFFSPIILRRLKDADRKNLESGTAKAPSRPALTVREAEVLQFVAEGEANKQIAARLGISIKTVEKHRQQLMDKLSIHDTAGLTRHAIATGVIESSIQSTVEKPSAPSVD